MVWNVSFASTSLVLGPTGRQIQLEVDGNVRAARRDTQAHANLTIGNLACRACVLTLHADRMLALFEKASVVEDPRVDRLMLGHRRDGISCGCAANVAIAPV